MMAAGCLHQSAQLISGEREAASNLEESGEESE
jgi:hypothetical protein